MRRVGARTRASIGDANGSPVACRTSPTTPTRRRTNRKYLFPFVRSPSVPSPGIPRRRRRARSTDASSVLASSPSRRRRRHEIPVARRVAREFSQRPRDENETKRNETYLGGSLGDERRGGDGASGGGRNGERHRRTCASCVVTSAPQGPCAQKASVGVHFASHDPSRKKKRTSFPPRLALAVWCCLWMCVCTNSICGCVVVEISGAAFRLWALG